MALAPQFAATLYGKKAARHVLELYADFVCPFSRKQLNGIKAHLLPRIDSGELSEDLAVVFRCTPQPWHASSTFVHEAYLAVVKAKPEKAWNFAFALMDAQEEYFDEAVASESPIATKARLAGLASSTTGLSKDQFLSLVSTSKGNSGSEMTADLKLQVKLGRQNGIHVTPTVLLDGLVDGSVSSSFGAEEWGKWVEEKIKQ